MIVPWKFIEHWVGLVCLRALYEEALAYELGQKNVGVRTQVLLPVSYKGKILGNSLRVDMLVDDLVIIECKATTQYNPVFESQLLTYLRVSKLKLGLLINFGETLIKNGIHRVVNGL